MRENMLYAAILAMLGVLLHDGALENGVKMGAYFKEQLFALQKRYPDIIGEVRPLFCPISIVMSAEQTEEPHEC
jgi:4-aminobutyrate aminotransferase-like enzyme